jgi:hypothetical protein
VYRSRNPATWARHKRKCNCDPQVRVAEAQPRVGGGRRTMGLPSSTASAASTGKSAIARRRGITRRSQFRHRGSELRDAASNPRHRRSRADQWSARTRRRRELISEIEVAPEYRGYAATCLAAQTSSARMARFALRLHRCPTGGWQLLTSPMQFPAAHERWSEGAAKIVPGYVQARTLGSMCPILWKASYRTAAQQTFASVSNFGYRLNWGDKLQPCHGGITGRG